MFGSDMTVGLTTRFSSDTVNEINTEEDLEVFLNLNDQVNENVDKNRYDENNIPQV